MFVQWDRFGTYRFGVFNSRVVLLNSSTGIVEESFKFMVLLRVVTSLEEPESGPKFWMLQELVECFCMLFCMRFDSFNTSCDLFECCFEIQIQIILNQIVKGRSLKNLKMLLLQEAMKSKALTRFPRMSSIPCNSDLSSSAGVMSRCFRPVSGHLMMIWGESWCESWWMLCSPILSIWMHLVHDSLPARESDLHFEVCLVVVGFCSLNAMMWDCQVAVV